MWCVVYAGDDREEKTEDFIKALLPASSYTRCFHLVQHKAQKSQGMLRDVVRKYLPGYVFIETDKPEAVHDILKKTPKRLLFSDNWAFHGKDVRGCRKWEEEKRVPFRAPCEGCRQSGLRELSPQVCGHRRGFYRGKRAPEAGISV